MMEMRRTGLEVPCIVIWALAAWGPTSTAAATVPCDDRALSAGRWDVAAVEWDGTPMDPEWLARFHVVYSADGSWAVLLKEMTVAEGRSTIRQDASPKAFDMETLGSEGIEPSRFTGIYRIDGDTRMLCIVRRGTPPPDDFSAPRNSGRMLVTLRRAKQPSGGVEQTPGVGRGWSSPSPRGASSVP
jgi:uncharacterized protein (TIGR03067 family)